MHQTSGETHAGNCQPGMPSQNELPVSFQVANLFRACQRPLKVLHRLICHVIIQQCAEALELVKRQTTAGFGVQELASRHHLCP